MAADPFAERLAKVRDRFASRLEGNIRETYAALPSLAGEGAQAVEALGETYRRIHGICGTGPTIGFPATGQAARNAESVILAAYRSQRGLTAGERSDFEQKLHQLRAVARTELQTNRSEQQHTI
jgi:hypothetical protein